MNSKEAHSNRPVGFPQPWLKFFDSRTQIAALILTKYWMRKGRRRWRDKHNVAQKKGPDLIVVSDKEAAELGVSPRAKQKILRELTSDGLIALTRRPGESSTIEVLLADAKSSN